METLEIKKLTDKAILPVRGSEGAAAYDLYADSVEFADLKKEREDGSVQISVKSENTVKVHTGIAMKIPKGYVGLIFPRSGLATKQGLRLSNCVGVIDEDYRGEIIIMLHSDAHSWSYFDLKSRVAQIMFVKYDIFDIKEVDELDITERGVGGFGSTGAN